MTLEYNDYAEPACPLSRPCSCSGNAYHHRGKSIPLSEIIAECDRLFNANRSAELGDFLRSWRERAREYQDKAGELSILSELMGHYRMNNDPRRGIPAVRDGFALIAETGIAGSVQAGTILINGATALHAFGENAAAWQAYTDAARCYGDHLDPADWRFAGLFNNMAAVCISDREFDRAEVYYLKALDILIQNNNPMDTAVTCVNLAQLYAVQEPDNPSINDCLDSAMLCFNAPETERNGYYAHTCLKCASAFGELGRKDDETELKLRAENIYGSH